MVFIKKPLRPKVALRPVAVKSKLGTKVVVYIVTVLAVSTLIAVANLWPLASNLGIISANEVGRCNWYGLIKGGLKTLSECQAQTKSYTYCQSINGVVPEDCNCKTGQVMPFALTTASKRDYFIDKFNNKIAEPEEVGEKAQFNDVFQLGCGVCPIISADPAVLTPACNVLNKDKSCVKMNGPASDFYGNWALKQATSKLWSKMAKLYAKPTSCQILPPGCTVTRVVQGAYSATKPGHGNGMAMDICCGRTPDLSKSDKCTGVVQDLFTQILTEAKGTGLSVIRECTAIERSFTNGQFKCGSTNRCEAGLIHLYVGDATPVVITNCDYNNPSPL